jgi:hypothetical protein
MFFGMVKPLRFKDISSRQLRKPFPSRQPLTSPVESKIIILKGDSLLASGLMNTRVNYLRFHGQLLFKDGRDRITLWSLR